MPSERTSVTLTDGVPGTQESAGLLPHAGREIGWSIHLRTDLELIYTAELRRRDHHPKPGTSLSDLGRHFHLLSAARLEHLQGKKLRVRYSREMKTHAPVPAIAELARRARRGEPLWPYLSKETRKVSFDDGLLSHWGIIHLHLGEGFDTAGYAMRSGDLLYAWVSESEIYFLRVCGHSFADEELLNVLVRNWPELLEPYRLRSTGGGSAVPPALVRDGRMKQFTRTMLVHPARAMSEGETTALRDAGVTPTFVAETGARYSAPGGGASCAGTGMHPRIRADHEVWWANRIEMVVASELPQLVQQIETHRGSCPGVLEFHLEDLDALRAAAVVETNTRVRFNLPMSFDYDFDPARVLAPVAAAAATRR